MISHAMMLILGGCLLGAIQLVVGIAIGQWFQRSDRAEGSRGRQDMLHANEIAKRLQQLADEMSYSVGEHRTRLDEATRLLTSGENRNDESLTELVVDVIGDIVRANQCLQTKLETAESRLEEQAAEIEAHISRSLTDPLTGLPNRREFNDRLEERMAAWSRRQEPFSLLLLDVDHFKRLNDEHGHLAGDQVLAAIGRALRGSVRREDAVARYGGEEFAILLPNTSLEQAIQVAQKVREAVSATAVQHDGKKFAVNLSGGIAMIGPNEGPESLIQRADAALYSAKAAGRNCAFVHDGIECRPADGFQDRPSPTCSPASELATLIRSPEVPHRANGHLSDETDIVVGAYLPREAISPELAEKCEALRRYVVARGQSAQEAVSCGDRSESIASPRAPQ